MTLSHAAASIAVAGKPIGLSQILSINRGGALTTAATAVLSSALLTKRNDNGDQIQLNDQVQMIPISISRGGGKKQQVTTQGLLTPQGLSVLYMAIAMSLHYLSYSIARPTTVALFTSAKMGFAGNTAAFPLAMAFISPTSLSLLLLYGKILGRAGPRGAIRQTTFLVASMLGFAAVSIDILSDGFGSNILIPFFGIAKIPLLQALVGALFIFRESYVQLLTSQYWSFMASILNPEQSAKWFSPISGLTSITSAIAGLGVTRVVETAGLPGALAVAGLFLLCSLIFTEKAYAIADKVSNKSIHFMFF